jgi:hypothetical protein
MGVLTPALGSPWRWVLACSALVAAIAHVPVIAPHLDEAPYMGVLFIVLTAACLVLAGSVLIRDVPAVYGLAILTCGLAIIGYAATRLVAFPELDDDVGNWLEPLGVLSVLAEAVVVLAAVSALRSGAKSAPGQRRRSGATPLR